MAEMLTFIFKGGPLDGGEAKGPDVGFRVPFGVPAGPSAAPDPGSNVWKGSALFGTTHAAWYEPGEKDESGRVVYKFTGYREV